MRSRIRSTRASQNLALAGATLFVLSDAVLGFDRFARALPHGKLIVMVTYYAAQTCLTLSSNGISPRDSKAKSSAPPNDQILKKDK